MGNWPIIPYLCEVIMFIANFVVASASASMTIVNHQRAKLLKSGGSHINTNTDVNVNNQPVIAIETPRVPRMEGESVRDYLKKTFKG